LLFVAIDRNLPLRPACPGWRSGPECNFNVGRKNAMRTLEIIVALVLAAVVFVAAKLIGFVLHIALIGAVVGLVVGFVIARAFRGAS
jgi:hypothetical protein